jgi:hypothetical protein
MFYSSPRLLAGGERGGFYYDKLFSLANQLISSKASMLADDHNRITLSRGYGAANSLMGTI